MSVCRVGVRPRPSYRRRIPPKPTFRAPRIRFSSSREVSVSGRPEETTPEIFWGIGTCNKREGVDGKTTSINPIQPPPSADTVAHHHHPKIVAPAHALVTSVTVLDSGLIRLPKQRTTAPSRPQAHCTSLKHVENNGIKINMVAIDVNGS